MRRRPSPNGIDAARALQEIAGCKRGARRTILRRIEQNVWQAGGTFDALAAAGGLDALRQVPLAAEEVEAMHHCYTGETKARDQMLTAVKEEVFGSVVESCVYCASVEELTWDHYAPKETFPELSVHPRNLVRACYPCNHSKGSVFGDNAGHRIVRHVYSDVVPAMPYLTVVLRPGRSMPVPYYQIADDQLTAAEFQALSRHYERFDLYTVYQKRAIERMADIVNEFRSFPSGTDREVVRLSLQNRITGLVGRYFLNDWRVALARTLAASEDFISLCSR